MSADTLRRAAAAMRENAEAATPGPWSNRRGPAEHVVTEQEAIATVVSLRPREDRRHIAAADPPFVLAVADWLDEAADHLDVHEDDDLDPALRPHVCPTAIEGPECSVLGQALTVARAYLGEEA